MGIIDLLNRARQIKNETRDGANTAERVGGVLVDIVDAIDNINLKTEGIEEAPADGNMYARQDRKWASIPVEELMNQVFPLSFRTFSSGGTFEVGQTVTPILSWSLERKNEEVLPESATVNGSTNGVSADFKTYSGTAISGDTSYHVSVTYGSQSVERTASYSFRYKKYWGASEKPVLDSADVLAMSSSFATSKAMGKTVFNCTGGKYPYYILPAEMASGVEVWVNGFRNSDLDISELEVTNSFNMTKMYKVIRLNNIQTGVLNVEFK